MSPGHRSAPAADEPTVNAVFGFDVFAVVELDSRVPSTYKEGVPDELLTSAKCVQRPTGIVKLEVGRITAVEPPHV
jgi:hypothetical protein